MLFLKPYVRERAVRYAERWAFRRNSLFGDFERLGGNCTNFVSQCVLAGSCTMNYTVDFGWYYLSPEDRAPAWSGVEFFYDFMIGAPAFASQNGGVGPYASEVAQEAVEIGDVIQLANRMGDWYHTLIVSGFDGDEILVCAQSNDALDRPLSTYTAAADKRFLHIEGVRIEINDDLCYERLIAGDAVDPLPPAELEENV